MSRQEMQQSGEVQQQTIRRTRRVVSNLGSEAAEKAFGSDGLFRRNDSSYNMNNGQHSNVEIKVMVENV